MVSKQWFLFYSGADGLPQLHFCAIGYGQLRDRCHWFFSAVIQFGRDRPDVTTPTRTVTYLIRKWGSNLLRLVVLVAVMTAMAPVMQWLRGGSAVFDWWQFVIPIWLFGLLVMSLSVRMGQLSQKVHLV